MREAGFHNPPHKFVKPGYGLAVPLRKDEVAALGDMAREAGFKRLSLFCAAVLRAALPPDKRVKLVAERGVGRSHQEATSPPVVASGETGPPAESETYIPYGRMAEVEFGEDERGRYAIFPLTRGKTAIVDESDWRLVCDQLWYAREAERSWYARSSRTGVPLHRLIMGITDPETFVDHTDRDGLNCRRYNLRIATRSQNQHNRAKKIDSRSPFKGVRPTNSGKWKSEIYVNGVHHYLGTFDNAEDAASAYDSMAVRLTGEFARTNFPIVEPNRAARRWEDITDAEERMALAKGWQPKVPLPEGFKVWEKERKLAWMNANWPLGVPEDGEGW